MKTIILFLLVAGLGMVMSSCEIPNRVIPSGHVTTQEEHFSGYDAIDVSNAFTVYVNFSDTEESIEIEADDNLQPYIEVRKISGTLIIGLRNNINVRGNATMRAYITTRQVIDYTASGASGFFIEDPLTANTVSIHLSGASFFEGKLEVNHLSASLSGASNVELEGSADSFNISASGTSNIGDYDFVVDDLDVDLSGASNVWLTVNNELSVRASGASNVYYRGTGVVVSQNLSGASHIIKE